jgi:hypothetical protein
MVQDASTDDRVFSVARLISILKGAKKQTAARDFVEASQPISRGHRSR